VIKNLSKSNKISILENTNIPPCPHCFLTNIAKGGFFLNSGFDTVPQCLIKSKQKQKQRNKKDEGLNRMRCSTFQQHTTACRKTKRPSDKIGVMVLNPNLSDYQVQGSDALFVLVCFFTLNTLITT